jgi:hypothetical protein
MMAAYLLYSYYNKSDETSSEYMKFSYEILNMFKNYKTALYELSFSENVLILLALNIFYKYSSDLGAKKLILDLGDFLITKFQEKDYYSDSIDDCSLFCICLMDAYKHTEIISFRETANEIAEKLISLYDTDKNIFIKVSEKKDSKYSCLEINLYLLFLIMYSFQEDKVNELKPIISGFYRKCFINNGLLTSWPEAPTLDEVERYKKLSLRSDDMLDETYFRMPVSPTPKSTGLAPVFVKSLSYSKRKDSLSAKRTSFDSNKNMFNFFLIIYLFKDTIEEFMEFTSLSKTDISSDSKNTVEFKDNCIKDFAVKKSNINIDNENSLDQSKSSSSIPTDFKNNLNNLGIEECNTADYFSPKNINAVKKINNDPLPNRNKISKINSSFKNKKGKKNKTQHPKKRKG